MERAATHAGATSLELKQKNEVGEIGSHFVFSYAVFSSFISLITTPN